MFKNIAKIFSSHILVKVIGLLNIAIILSFLEVFEFGLYSYYLVMLNLIAVIIDPFLSAYLVEYKLNNYKKYNVGIFTFSILLLPLFYVILRVNFEIDLSIFLWFSFSFILSGIIKSFLNVNERFFKYGLVDVFRQMSILLSTIVCFYFLEKNYYLFLLKVNYISATIVLIMILPFFIKTNEVFLDLKLKTLKRLFQKSKFLIFYTALIPVIGYIDSYFVEKYLTENDLGMYSFSLKVYSISLMLIIPIFTVLNIKQIEIAKEKKYTVFLKENIKKVITYALIILIIAFTANYLISHYFYPVYRASFLDSSILLFGAFITYVSMPFSFLIAYKKYKWLFLLSILALISNIVINALFITKYGTIIAALSTFLSQIIINLGAAIVSYYILEKE